MQPVDSNPTLAQAAQDGVPARRGTDALPPRAAMSASWRSDRRAPSPTMAYGSLERSFAACGLIAAGGTAAGAALTIRGYGAAPLLGVTFLVLLLCVLLGSLARDRVIQFQRGEVARVYVNAIEAPRRAAFERRGAPPGRVDTLRRATADLAASLRMTVFGRDRVRLWAVSMRRALDDRAEISKALAATLGEDAHAIAAAATLSRRAEAEIGAGIGVLFDRAARAVSATETMEDEVATLQASVRETTAQLRQASALAASLADNAMNAQHGVVAVSGAAQSLLIAAERIRGALDQAVSVEPGSGASEDMRSLSAGGQQAVDNLTQAARALKDDASAMQHAVQVIGDGVQAHGALGQALSAAVSRQLEDVARIAGQAAAARAEVVALQLQTATIKPRDLGLGASPAARRAVERLPDHAEAIARILRDLPSFDDVRG